MKKRKEVSRNFYVFALCGAFFAWTAILGMPFEKVYAGDDQSVDDIQGDIKDLSKKIQKEKQKLDGLTKNLQVINGNLSVTQSAIQNTQTHIQTAQETIARKEAEIARLEDLLEEQRGTLREVVQLLYDVSQTPIAEVMFHEEGVSQLLDGSEEVMTIQDQVKTLVSDSIETKEKIETERQSVVGLKQEKEKLLASQSNQKQNLLEVRQDTQEDIEDKQETIEELQKKLAELQSDIASLTGRSYNAKDIRDAINYASDKTGVPAKVLYGFLKVETNLGANTGQCTYSDVVKTSLAGYKRAGATKYKKSIALLYKRRDLFYDLVSDLGYNKEKKVSCSPKNYIGQGGAMGVSQFMSDVWLGYASSVSAKTGHSTPDPWNLTDGVTAMAIKLRNAGVTSSSSSAIKKGVANYLGVYKEFYYKGVLSGMKLYDMKN